MRRNKVFMYLVFFIALLAMQGCTKPYSVPRGAKVATLDMKQVAKVERTGTIIINAKHSRKFQKDASILDEEELGLLSRRGQVDDISFATTKIEANKRLRLLVRNGYQADTSKWYRCDNIIGFTPKEGRKYQLLSYSDMSLGTKSTCTTKVYDITTQRRQTVQFSEYSKYVSQIQ